MDLFKDIEEFHKKFQLTYDGLPRMLPKDIAEFRTRFMQEELDEYEANDHILIPSNQITAELEGKLDALVDLVYVALGTAYLHGFDFNEAWRRVHQANMAKVRAQKVEDSKRGSTFDVVKPPGWIAPRHRDLVEHHAHKEEPDVIG